MAANSVEPGFYAIKIGDNIKKIEVMRVIGGKAAGEPCYLECSDRIRELGKFMDLSPARIEKPVLADELHSIIERLFRLMGL